jgi:hypothetical protein
MTVVNDPWEAFEILLRQEVTARMQEDSERWFPDARGDIYWGMTYRLLQMSFVEEYNKKRTVNELRFGDGGRKMN